MDVESPFISRFDPKPAPALPVDSSVFDRLLDRSVALQLFHYFGIDILDDLNNPDPVFKLTPSQSYIMDEYTRFPTMREVFIEFISSARFRNCNGKGVPIADHAIIYHYDPLAVERINIYKGPHYLSGIQFDGIIELITYRRLHENLDLNKSTQIIPYEGPQSPCSLLTPDYSVQENRLSRRPDSRHTLLWKPSVQTARNSLIHIPFDTSDLTGDFQVTVEGITKDGKIIYETAFFRVE